MANLNLFREIKEGVSKRSIAFLHTNSGSCRIFDDIFAQSSEYSLFRFDLPGHDRSGPSFDGSKYEHQELLKIVREELEQNMTDEFILLGISLGGHLALEIMNELPKCSAVIISGSPPLDKPFNDQEAFLPNQSLNSFLKPDVPEHELNETFEALLDNASLRKVMKQYFRRTDPIFREKWVASALGGQLQNEKYLVKESKLPIFYISGKNDPTVNMDYVRNLSGIEDIYEIENCGHYPSIEQPEIFRKIVNEICTHVWKS